MIWDISRQLQHLLDPMPEYEGGAFEIALYVDPLGKATVHYAVVDHNTPEMYYGSFDLDNTDVCEVDEIELAAFWDQNEEERMIGAVKHVVKNLGARQVILTTPASDDGSLVPQRPINRWMDYLETRPADADKSRFVDVYAWEVTL